MKRSPQYGDYSDMLHHLAWKWSYGGGADHDTLMAVAHTAFMDACGTYHSKKGSFSHWLFTVVSNRLNDFTQRWNKVIPSDTETVFLADLIVNRHPEWEPRRRCAFRLRLSLLSNEAHYVAQIVLDSPAEILKMRRPPTPKNVRGALRRHLRKQKWSWPRIWKTFHELEEFCR